MIASIHFRASILTLPFSDFASLSLVYPGSAGSRFFGSPHCQLSKGNRMLFGPFLRITLKDSSLALSWWTSRFC